MIPILYTLDLCPNCDKLKSTLRAAGVEFEERDLEAKMSIVDLRCRGCFPKEAPVLMTEDKVSEVGDLFTDEGRIEPHVLAGLTSRIFLHNHQRRVFSTVSTIKVEPYFKNFDSEFQ